MIVLCTWVDNDWVSNFCMTKQTFYALCAQLSGSISRQRTHLRIPIRLDMRVAITLWRLATNVENQTLSHLFSFGRSTVGKIVIDVCKAIVKILMPRVIRFYDTEDIVEGFQRKWGFPNCGGAVDGCHFPNLCPPFSATEYYNRKCYYSVVMQAVVDYRFCFTDINIGGPGKIHDARELRNSILFINGQAGALFIEITRDYCGVPVPVVILGDPSYPLLPWLMKPYHEQNDLRKRTFNYRLSRTRMVVECAFGRLKGRWRCLLKHNDHSIDNIPTVIAAYCVRHNLCESQSEEFLSEWLDEATDCGYGPLDSNAPVEMSGVPALRYANTVRDALADFFMEEA
ncbi:protein ANTAGONIST OF LIKE HETEROCHROMATIN PROTEIN 1-like [Huso huso]|uniref:Protein ANTAGONIST OF LIKE HETEROCHROMATIN PROTEIN 1-like n=1 Tax=Huso huso TaxID=61971 RepID=A0ABR0ZQS1_HUSHU